MKIELVRKLVALDILLCFLTLLVAIKSRLYSNLDEAFAVFASQHGEASPSEVNWLLTSISLGMLPLLIAAWVALWRQKKIGLYLYVAVLGVSALSYLLDPSTIFYGTLLGDFVGWVSSMASGALLICAYLFHRKEPDAALNAQA